MSEEEIIQSFIDEIEMLVNEYNYKSIDLGITEGQEDLSKRIDVFEGILDLYNKEKQKSKLLSDAMKSIFMDTFEGEYIAKDKIREILYSDYPDIVQVKIEKLLEEE